MKKSDLHTYWPVLMFLSRFNWLIDLFANFYFAIQIMETLDQQFGSIYKNEQLIYSLLQVHLSEVFLTVVLQ